MSKSKKMSARIDAMRETFVETQKRFNLEVQTLIKDEIDRQFTKFPGVNSVSWTQYTPYFNDGDECRFGANIEELQIGVVGQEDVIEVDAGSVNFAAKTVKTYHYNAATRSYDYITREATEAELFARQVHKLLKAAGGDVLKAAYGDHVTVIISREGTTTEDYDHD